MVRVLRPLYSTSNLIDARWLMFESTCWNRRRFNCSVSEGEGLVGFSACWRNILSAVTVVGLLSLAPPLAQTAHAQSPAPADAE